MAGEAPAATAVSKVRSAASRWRTVVQRRSQRLSVARSGRLASAARRRRGACPSQSAATRRAPWNKASRPTVAVLDPGQRDLPHDIRRRYAGRKLAVDRFGNDKAQDMPEAVVEALAPMRCRISVTESRPHPDLAVTQLGGGRSARRLPTDRRYSHSRDRSGRGAGGRSGSHPRRYRDPAESPYEGSDCRARRRDLSRGRRVSDDAARARPDVPSLSTPRGCPHARNPWLVCP